MLVPDYVQDFAEQVQAQFGGQTYVVGGACRDYTWGIEPHDFDLVIFQVSEENLQALDNYSVYPAGDRFGVYLVSGLEYRSETFEVALPQWREKTGPGRMDEVAHIDPFMAVDQDAMRRDYTINAIYFSVMGKYFVDPLGGMDDIQSLILRMIDPKNFADDPLRVYRGLQFCSRYNLDFDPATADAAFAQRDRLHSVSLQRVRQEWVKWAKGWYPSKGLRFLQACDWLPQVIDWMTTTEQDDIWHPEGNVFEHTCLAVDAMLENFSEDDNENDRVIMVFAALLHDVGKHSTTDHDEDGRIISPGHADAEREIKLFFKEITADGSPLIEDVLIPLIAQHMWNVPVVTKRSVGKLIRNLGAASLAQLEMLMLADRNGRGRGGWRPLPSCIVEAVSIAAEIDAVNGQPAQILMGRHLIEQGLKPGRDFGVILDNAFNAQLSGEFDSLDGALIWLSNNPLGN